MNTRDNFRENLIKDWKREDSENVSYIIKFGLFKMIIEKVEIENVTNPEETAQIENIMGTINWGIEIDIEMNQPAGNTKYKFNNRRKCLDTLVKSLNMLEQKHRNNNLDEIYM